MYGHIEEVHLRRPVCDDGCGPLAPLREGSLFEAETGLREHYEAEHSGLIAEGEDA